MSHSYVTTIRNALREAAEGRLHNGWMFLKNDKPPGLEDECLVDVSNDGVEESPLRAAFPQEGLETQDLEDIALGARAFQAPPSDQLLLEAFVYYWRFDAWLPFPGAPEPPPPEETKRKLDREFIDSLGPERTDTKCKKEGCSRGAVHHSVLCRVHHFEMLKKKPYPFPNDD